MWTLAYRAVRGRARSVAGGGLGGSVAFAGPVQLDRVAGVRGADLAVRSDAGEHGDRDGGVYGVRRVRLGNPPAFPRVSEPRPYPESPASRGVAAVAGGGANAVAGAGGVAGHGKRLRRNAVLLGLAGVVAGVVAGGQSGADAGAVVIAPGVLIESGVSGDVYPGGVAGVRSGSRRFGDAGDDRRLAEAGGLR